MSSKTAIVTLVTALLSVTPGCDPAPSGVDAAMQDAPGDAGRDAASDAGTPDALGDAPREDAPDDAGAPDAETLDVGVPDVGAPDVGLPDVGVADVGVSDVGVADGGMDDAGVDAGMPDAGIADAGTDAGMADGGTPDAPPSTIVLANGDDLPACGVYGGSIWPVIPSELGHYAATRLTPPAYPFVVDRVAYDLYAFLGGACDQSFAHEVRLFVGRSPTPPASPSSDGVLVATIPVPAGDPDDHTVTLDLATPVVLEAGEYLFVAVQLTGNATRSLCIGVCQTFAPVEGVDFWSNSTNEPYPWSDMVVDYSFLSNFTIRAYGRAL